jgi:diacylglycerol kinase (ATP)
VIVNPAAGRGRVRSFRDAILNRSVARMSSALFESRSAGDEERVTREAIEGGATTIVAVGGDGTCARIANAILRTDSRCSLAVIPSGTGNDFAKTLGVDRYTPEQVADLVERAEPIPIDVGRIEETYFINSCGFGFDASVLEATRRVRFLKGDAIYIYSALAQILTYRGLGISTDSNAASDARSMLMLTVSNGRFLGGAFRIAPLASVVDGQLDFGFFSDCNLIDRVRLFAEALRGTHLGHPSVRTERARMMSLRFSAPPMMEVDGELLQARSSTVRIECLPRALNVIAAPGFPP